MNELLYPRWFTTYEGGPWYEWNCGPIGSQELQQRDEANVVIGPELVHSMLFEDNSGPTTKYPRWDCVNGWTARWNSNELQDAITKETQQEEKLPDDEWSRHKSFF